ncbi:hypothetical protein [Streptococcus macacae]|uniref:Uncharacterized protein n=1 Tax=Streptococcus macacae NCTC 11558 TaxID=764298 RepID=G5JYZ8_9STRE|nr:hypothetical protein [Streptococcus macacae]EHJ51855.1 hypothetical protein STRMA_0414 [Streptococcus macacae NCTC 11558]SUN78254.1 Uncharacterised protein [Streptococcus macacae NCTC 11558]
MEKKANVWKVLGIVFIVLASVFIIATATMTTLLVLSNQEVHRLAENADKNSKDLSNYRKKEKKFWEDYTKKLNSYYKSRSRYYGNYNSDSDSSSGSDKSYGGNSRDSDSKSRSKSISVKVNGPAY